MLALARDAQANPARHQRVHPRTGGQQIHHERRGVDDVLVVVQHQQRRRSRKNALHAVDERLLASTAHPKGLRDVGDDRVRVGDRGQVDEADAVRNASSRRAATAMASRVLPTPPGPVSVSNRTSSRRSSATSDTISVSRPMREVSGAGRSAVCDDDTRQHGAEHASRRCAVMLASGRASVSLAQAGCADTDARAGRCWPPRERRAEGEPSHRAGRF